MIEQHVGVEARALPIREENLLPSALLADYQRLLAPVLAIALP